MPKLEADLVFADATVQTTAARPAALVWRAAWDGGTAYTIGDLVTTDLGSRFVAVAPSTGTDPEMDDGATWAQVVGLSGDGPLVESGGGDPGASVYPSRSDHVHPLGPPNLWVQAGATTIYPLASLAVTGAALTDLGGGGGLLEISPPPALSDADPLGLTASPTPGTATEASRSDHRHGTIPFRGLTDVPSSYDGAELYLVRVTGAGDGLEFVDPATILPPASPPPFATLVKWETT